MSELRTVRLYGKLGAKFGRVHQLAISSPREAIKALCVLYSGFERYLADAHLRGVELRSSRESIISAKMSFTLIQHRIFVLPR